MKSHHHVLVIGCGSIGERHLRTLLATARAEVTACDTRPAVRLQMQTNYGVETLEDWAHALESRDFTAVVICTPAPLHVGMALQAFAHGKHVLIEKPLAVELAGADELCGARDRAGTFGAVAYVYHCVPAFAAARKFIQAGGVGPIRHVVVKAGQHFPTFRPAYREIYYRDHAQGGGAIQDALTHMANMVEWIVGPTDRVYCDAEHQVLAGVEVEDTVNVTARNGGVLVGYAFNQFQAPNETTVEFHGEKGSVRVEAHAGRWGSLSLGSEGWSWQSTVVGNRDAVFAEQAGAFLDGCEGRPSPLCTLEQGLHTLRFNVAALRSARQGRPIDVKSGRAWPLTT